MSYKETRKRNFRQSEVKRKKGKWGKGLAFTFLMLARSVYAQQEPESTTVKADQLHMQIRTQITEEIQTFAIRHQWQDLETDIDIAIPASIYHLPVCPEPMIISASDQQALPIGNLKRQVSCDSAEQKWRINTTVKVRIKLPVVVAKTTINRDTKIDASMLKMQTLSLYRNKDFVTQFQAIIGKRTKRRIRSGQLVSPSYLQRRWLIEKGDEVLIVAVKDGMQASMKGIAMENGAESEQISVKNSRSSKIIRATVAGKGKVQTIF
ncbi:flagella basal body P-ring formation protein FlgA [Photobacterium proteolyticum]|uniref:Flagella basal body P-ring formation protein FlgA n=1 Tax=Photobacterium proteolyticum TaxID=1903952 RepID=A0A1Q9GVC4_9GAMM|nr:flagellar basal body P-ring formation chaperone FlgA [Photobacterium proteolyticum]OLQ79118.1 flagella basal body P-ring formation protein FlgA [Photobacterium proteolyticum]